MRPGPIAMPEAGIEPSEDFSRRETPMGYVSSNLIKGEVPPSGRSAEGSSKPILEILLLEVNSCNEPFSRCPHV